MNLRDRIREDRDRPRKTATVNLNGMGDVLLRQLKYGEIKDLITGEPVAQMTTMLGRMIVDESGARIFSDDDALELEALPPSSFNALVEAANDLNGLSRKQIEATTKN
jgi:hypothetical protein